MLTSKVAPYFVASRCGGQVRSLPLILTAPYKCNTLNIHPHLEGYSPTQSSMITKHEGGAPGRQLATAPSPASAVFCLNSAGNIRDSVTETADHDQQREPNYVSYVVAMDNPSSWPFGVV